MKIAVQQAEPEVVRAARSFADNPETAQHPIFNLSRGLGTGKATCRACNKPIKENERTLVFFHAPHEPDHEHHYRRVRMVIHEDDCSQKPAQTGPTTDTGGPVTCRTCGDSVLKKDFVDHWKEHGIGSNGWTLNRAASFSFCAKHNTAHCGQCEEDRKLEELKLDKRVPTIKKKRKASEEWQHTDEDGFEMWETKEKHNKFAIVENDETYDLYVLQGSFNSPEEAQAAADGMTRTAQDSGGGSSSGGGDGGSSSGSSGSSSSAGTGNSGISTSGESTDSSDNESSEAEISEGPRPPSTQKVCPKCDIPLEQTELLGNISGYRCGTCGYTYRRRKKRQANSWMNNLSDVQSLTDNKEEEIAELEIGPRIPPSLLPNSEPSYQIKEVSDIFTSAKTARSTVCARCHKTYEINKKGHFTGFCETCKEQLGMVTHKWDSEDARRGHDG